jgi:YbbR domain-containing protein
MDVILSGPVPVLNTLGAADVRVVVDLSGYDVGTYQFIPEVNILPERVQKASMFPATVEVTIVAAPTPTLTVTPYGTVVPLHTPTPTRLP